jgi:hypothetical protein
MRRVSEEEQSVGTDLTGRISVPEHVVHRQFEAETVLLNLQTGQYHGLNTTGGRLFELLEETGSAKVASERLAEEFGVSVEQVAADLEEFCDGLLSRGLIEIHPG